MVKKWLTSFVNGPQGKKKSDLEKYKWTGFFLILVHVLVSKFNFKFNSIDRITLSVMIRTSMNLMLRFWFKHILFHIENGFD